MSNELGVFQKLMRSRKFWLALTGLASVIAIEGLGMDPALADRISQAVIWLASVLIGGIAIEDGLSRR